MTIFFTIMKLHSMDHKKATDFTNENEEFYLNEVEEQIHLVEVNFYSL